MRKSSIKKVVTKIPLRESKSDFAYWQTQPYAARLAALEEIRQEYHRWKYGVQPRFQRVYRVVKQRKFVLVSRMSNTNAVEFCALWHGRHQKMRLIRCAKAC